MQTEQKKDKDRKGKPVERRGRKATGLNPDRSGHDSRAAEVILNGAFGRVTQRLFYPKHGLSDKKVRFVRMAHGS
jgi:hypothetical protein